MMEFWSENQGQPHLNSRFSTIPGRNWPHSHHDRHQAAHYPVYYGEQQDQGRESSYWAGPGSRAGGMQQEYTHWTDPELTSSSSSHFPFILDRHAQSHQDMGEYQQHEARDKDWATSHRAVRDYERGFLREGYQRRWEPGSPVRYSREFSAKRSDSSFRELEAWAARYSHSLPRRRRIEAELRGASQGLVESSRTLERDGRSGTDPQVTALQHVQQNPNSRVSGQWDRGCRQQAPNYYPSQAPALDASNALDMKENTGYQRRLFSHPPGYIAPPPYNSPHKCSPVMQHSHVTQEQGGKRQVPWPQAMLRKQGLPKELHDKRKEEKDESKTCPEVEGLKYHRQETGATQTVGPFNTQNTHMHTEGVLALQHPQAVQNLNMNQKTSKIIEGRKFRLNKKTGGMTIFCLVSRIAGATEAPSLPLCTSQTNIQSQDRREVSQDLEGTSEIRQMHKFADEVDFRSSTLTEQPCASDVRKLADVETLTCTGKEVPGICLPNKDEVDNVSMEKNININDGDSTVGRQAGQAAQPSSGKYPLWREPGSTSRAETPTSCITANIGEKDVFLNDTADNNCIPVDTEMRTEDIEEDTKDPLIIDSTSVVKMELIPSPKKEHVHYLGSIANPETSPFDNQTVISSELNCQLNQDMTNDQDAEQLNESCETGLDLKLLEQEEQKGQSEVSSPCLQPSSLSERETLKERAERILGISLLDNIAKQKPKDKESALDLCPAELRAEEGESQSHLELSQIEDAVCLETHEHGEDFAASPEGVVDASKEKDSPSQLETDKASPESEVTQGPLLRSPNETCKHESQLICDISSKPPDLCNSSLSPLDSKFTWNIFESSIEGGVDPELVELTSTVNLSSNPETLVFSRDQLSSPLPSGSTDSLSLSAPHTEHLPSPTPPLDLTFQPANVESGAEDGIEEGKASCLTINEVTCESVATDVTEDTISQQKAKFHHSVEAACPTDKQQTKDADKDPDDEEEQRPFRDTDVLPQQLEFVQTECDTCLEESNVSDEQTPIDTNVDPTDSMIQTAKMDENESSNFCQNEAIIPQNQIHIGISQDPNTQTESSPLPAASDCEASLLDELSFSEFPSFPLESDTEFGSLLNENPDCPAAPSIAETHLPSLQLDCCEEASHLSFGSLTDPSPLPQEENLPPGCPAAHKEEPEYPKSLWDVVNHIRKHTAPDSENEEEDMCELWDPDNVSDNLSSPDVAVDMSSDKLVCDEAKHEDVSEDSVEMGHMQPDQKEPKEHVDEDTLSCSSTSSHGSEDTVIEADEDGSEETTLCAMTEKNEKFDTNDKEQCCPVEVKDKTLVEESEAKEEEAAADTRMSGRSEECPVKEERI